MYFNMLRTAYLTIDGDQCACRNLKKSLEDFARVASIQYRKELFVFPDTMVALECDEPRDVIVDRLLSTIGWGNVKNLTVTVIDNYSVRRLSGVLIFKNSKNGRVLSFSDQVTDGDLSKFIKDLKEE